MSAIRWLIVVACVVLVILLLSFARGERQRGEDTPEAAGIVLSIGSFE
ncbi:MAG TPA: hypothetical protein VFO17_10925 [Acidimicrobiia bacterium]|jgi:hypothetical protein|nr:hypothetical protein [Acidimicrobiia bacterium]